MTEKKQAFEVKNAATPDRKSAVSKTAAGKSVDGQAAYYPGPRRPRYGLIALFLTISIGGAIVVSLMSRPARTQTIVCEVIKSHPHDTKAFTQGLQFIDGKLYESTGLDGDDATSRSVVRIVDLESGKTLKEHELPDRSFGEGLTLLNDKIYQLTWKDKKLFVYDKQLELIEERDFPHEGWGLTTDGQYLIMTDGSAMLKFFEPDSLKLVGGVEVRYRNYLQGQLNELEYVDGFVYANVWQSDQILKIDPNTGIAIARINMEGLYEHDRKSALNGIAYDEVTEHWYVTGKLWSKLFEVRFVEE